MVLLACEHGSLRGEPLSWPDPVIGFPLKVEIDEYDLMLLQRYLQQIVGLLYCRFVVYCMY